MLLSSTHCRIAPAKSNFMLCVTNVGAVKAADLTPCRAAASVSNTWVRYPNSHYESFIGDTPFSSLFNSISMTNEKKSKNAGDKTGKTDSTTPETPKTAGSLAAKIKQIPIEDLRSGDKVLYPGNRVIPVSAINHYVQLVTDNGAISDNLVYLVYFEGQPSESPVLAFFPGMKIYIYAG